MELLSPAGSFPALTAAVRAGADAVYLGVENFNARRNAHNFTLKKMDETTVSLAEAVAFCHARGVKVHLTLNTLVTDRELPEALAVAEGACACGVDALIIQDRGLARRIHAAAPAMPLHASTQLTCHTPAGVERLRDVGFSRVVLAREMSRDEIAACTGRGCEIEVFVHGALCMCVSGQCELSALLGGRSGNRGMCAQPCRLPFAIGHRPQSGEAALSLRDQSLAEHLEELRDIGVASLKIEGRMKRPEYVAAATAVLRSRLDGQEPPRELVEDLEAVFSRSGFTDGYFTGHRDRRLFGVRRAEDVTAATAAVFSRLERLYDRETQRVPVSARLTAEPLAVTVTDREGHCVTATDAQAPRRDCPPPAERLKEQLEKSGGTPFAVTAEVIDLPPVPLSSVNALRRQALSDLQAMREAPCPVAYRADRQPSPVELPTGFLTGLVARAACAEQVTADADAWIVPLSVVPAVPFWGVEIPRGMFGREDALRRELAAARRNGAAFALCNTVGAVPLAREAGLVPVGGAFLNVTNREAVRAVAEDGVAATVLSFELTLPQLRAVAEGGGCLGLFAYGRQPLMLMRACPSSVTMGCERCGGRQEAVDRTDTHFPIRCAGGCSELLNSVPLYWADRLSDLPPSLFRYLHFTDESPSRVREVLQEYRHGGTPPLSFTRGLYKRGVE